VGFIFCALRIAEWHMSSLNQLNKKNHSLKKGGHDCVLMGRVATTMLSSSFEVQAAIRSSAGAKYGGERGIRTPDSDLSE
jgi:hypothetical protein